MEVADEPGAMTRAHDGTVTANLPGRPQGRKEIFDTVFSEILPRLYRAAVLLTGGPDRARDVVHDAYLKLARRPERFLAHPEPYAYAFVAVANLARDQWRRNRRMVPMADLTEDQRRCDPWAVPAPRHPADADGPGDAVLLLRHLTFKQARSILLVDIEGYSVDEAAELIRVHRSTLAITRRRGLARLRAILEQEARETRSHAEQDDG